MRSYGRNNSVYLKNGEIFRSRLWLITGIIFGLVFLWDMVGPFGLWKLHRMKKEHKRIYLSVLEINKKNAALEDQIKRLKDDPEYQEYTIRRELGWVRDNEILYKFLDKES
ncbi:MAG: septum formation initiator family protein [Deltaproteobacteria bacterium]|nr:septum formation initiator family protein [Deltaproteobacteria bacterium]MBW1965148.1 septum formation initiator family protein [Deltaproteobacteria bacterium]MBW2080712.1 septum formation initiator family protein [Deltaproteobacteria bacterium]